MAREEGLEVTAARHLDMESLKDPESKLSHSLATKVIDDGELEVEIAQNTKVRVMRAMVADVRVKGEPAAANDSGKK